MPYVHGDRERLESLMCELLGIRHSYVESEDGGSEACKGNDDVKEGCAKRAM